MWLLSFLILILFGTQPVYGEYAIGKNCEWGVVVLFPQTGTVKFLCSVPSGKDRFCAGFQRTDKRLMVKDTWKEGPPQHSSYQDLLLIDPLRDYYFRFDPLAFGLECDVSFAWQVTPGINILCAETFQGELQGILWNEVENKVIDRNYPPEHWMDTVMKNTSGVPERSPFWSRPLMKEMFPFMKGLDSQAVYFSHSFSGRKYMLLTVDLPISREAREEAAIPPEIISQQMYLFLSGMAEESEQDTLIMDFQDYALLIRGLTSEASFGYIDLDSYPLQPDEAQFRAIIAAPRTPAGTLLSAEEAGTIAEKALRRAFNEGLFSGLSQEAKESPGNWLSEKLTQENSCYWMELELPFSCQTFDKTFSFPVRIQMVINADRSATQQLLWFTATLLNDRKPLTAVPPKKS